MRLHKDSRAQELALQARFRSKKLITGKSDSGGFVQQPVPSSPLELESLNTSTGQWRRTHTACLSISEGTEANLSLMKRGSQRVFEVAKLARRSANTPLCELCEVDLSRASLLDDEENSLEAHERKVMVILLLNAFEYW